MLAVKLASLRRALSKPLVLHPASIAVGVIFAGLVLLSMAQTVVPATMPLRIEYLPHPSEIFRIEEGAQYTVPQGKVFVLMGIGRTNVIGGGGYIALAANGVSDCTQYAAASMIATVPPCMTYQAGTALAVQDATQTGGNDCYAVGYLAAK